MKRYTFLLLLLVACFGSFAETKKVVGTAGEKAVKALTDAGVPASSITSSYYGDTVQPFADNDKNRVTIINATGKRDGTDKKTVRKFKTKDVRYRVK